MVHGKQLYARTNYLIDMQQKAKSSEKEGASNLFRKSVSTIFVRKEKNPS